MPNDAVLAGGVERLQHDEQGLAAVRVKQVLQLVHAFDMGLDLRQSLLMGLVLAGVGRIDFRQPNLRTEFDHEILPIVHAASPMTPYAAGAIGSPGARSSSA